MCSGFIGLGVGQTWHVCVCSFTCCIIIFMSTLQIPQNMLRLAQTMGTAPEGDRRL